MAEATLVLVCKRPGLGMGKQRLAANLGQEAANRVAEALLACALEDARAWPGPVVIAPAHWRIMPGPRLCWRKCIRRGTYQPQAEGNLGQRLNTLDSELRAVGLEKLVYIGSDAPALGAANYAAASEALEHHDTRVGAILRWRCGIDGEPQAVAAACRFAMEYRRAWASRWRTVAVRRTTQWRFCRMVSMWTKKMISHG